ncbi:acyl-CoA dehydrogenase [Kordiimonas sediminis]|uniref:Acyl-CoA dehydrogenase n=1 Tax=Kordiimonas sediminis TaxID=1735581 RepID=A0A919AQ26_9PROT|nr:acyl-CoA dehydrogenase family protein [Kordiimonas sediminis]GHF17979.1 acyl-CoA dehydrogenase [Kordiimonas sediminis]
MSDTSTHEVFNQVPVYGDINLYESDRTLQAAVKAEGGAWGQAEISALGQTLGTVDSFHQGHLANVYTPQLHSFDQRGYRSDQVEFHPAYHQFMSLSKASRIHCGAFDYLAADTREKGQGIGTVRAAKHFMMGQVEAGHVCPITMTHAAIPTLQIQEELADLWLPKMLSTEYDPAFKPVAEKAGVTIGMGMTEKQGGTDVRANSTTATPVGQSGPGKPYHITGHKWFMSAPMCDAFLVLAQAEGGLSVFLVPRFRASGDINGLQFQRLKNKLGNKSNASSEVEFRNAEGYLIGEEGRGIANIMTMANYTRLDCALGSAGQMRQALARAHHHVSHRTVFQKKLIDQPMMTSLIADLTLESEAATHLAMRLAGAYEGQYRGSEDDTAFARVMTPVIKYWVTKRAPGFAYEAMECLGGNGYIEDGIMARLYRDLPVNSIWEGSGSVMCLDLLRVLMREPGAVQSVLKWLQAGRGGSQAYDTALGALVEMLSTSAVREADGRILCERLATLAASRIMAERSPAVIASAYTATRLDPHGKTGAYGALLATIDGREIIQAAFGT